jgi:ABC-2 type transport system permease protein
MELVLRYGRLTILMMKNCLVREMQFRANFLIRVVTEVLWLGMQLVFLDVIYSNTPDVAGWNRWQMIALLGTIHLVNQLFEAFFFDNCARLVDEIRLGELDFILLKPVNSQFMVSLRYTDFASFLNGFLGVGLVAYAMGKLGVGVTLGGGILYAGLVLNGIAILYTMMFCLSTFTFWLGRSNNLFELYYQLGQFSRYPGEIYRWLLRAALLTVIPMLVVSNFPAKALFGSLPAAHAAAGFLLGAVFLGLTTVVWRFGLARYRSASS